MAVIHVIDWLQCVITDSDATQRDFYQQGTDVVIHYQHEYTTDLHYSLLIDDVKVYETSAAIPNPRTNLIQDSLIISGQSQLIPVGQHNVTLHVTNDYVDLQCYSVVTVMSPVSGVSLESSHKAAVPGDDILLTVTAESGFPALIEWMIRDREGHSVVWNAVQERKGRTAQDVDQMTISLSESELILAAPRK